MKRSPETMGDFLAELRQQSLNDATDALMRALDADLLAPLEQTTTIEGKARHGRKEASAALPKQLDIFGGEK